MYSQIISKREHDAIMRSAPAPVEQFANSIFEPSLAYIASAYRNGMLQEMIENYNKHVAGCDCWFCFNIKFRPIITGQDLYLRFVFNCSYYSPKIALN
jgi:hypothetical protein